jgi:hypothetical protein
MANDSLDRRYTCIYRSIIEQGCLDCSSQHPCPPLIVIAMRYAREMAPADLRAVTPNEVMASDSYGCRDSQ